MTRQSYVVIDAVSTAQKSKPMPKKMVFPSALSDGDVLSLSKPCQIFTSVAPGVTGGVPVNSGPGFGLCPVWQTSWRYIDHGPSAGCADAGPPNVSTSAVVNNDETAV